MKKTVPVSDLKFGNYVHELDRPWTDTPFMFQGFVLRTPDQLEVIRKFCKSVTIDTERSETGTDARLQSLSSGATAPKAAASSTGKTNYVETASIEQELQRARTDYARCQAVVSQMLASVRSGRTLDADQIEGAVTSMAQSVVRNPDALLLYAQLSEKGEYTISHALDVAVYMIAFGRFLQMSEDKIILLGHLGLLQDIGKIRLPNLLLEKRDRLSMEEFEQAKLHVKYSAEILAATPGLPADLAKLALLHHERHDGSGYPNQLKGKEIGTIGSIAAIIDTFDALTVHRPYAAPVAPSVALNMLYKWRSTFFDAVLVEQFIRCIGIFPVGSVVELNSGEIGIVIAQNLVKRLQPRVMVTRDEKGNPLRPQKLLDLSRNPKMSADEVYRIRRTLELGRITVRPEELFMQ